MKIIPTENTIDKEKEKEEGGGGMTITTEEGDVGEGEKGAREKGEKKEEGKGEELNSTMGKLFFKKANLLFNYLSCVSSLLTSSCSG